MRAKVNDLTCILDGNNVLLRSRAALVGMQTKGNTLTGGVYGSIKIFMALQAEFEFSDAIWAFDWGRSVFRRSVRASYKQKRLTEEKDEAAPQFKLLEEFLSIINVPFIRIEGVEADDIISSLCRQIDKDKMIVSADHDLLQLVNDQTIVAKPSVGKGVEALVDASDVILKYGLPPERLAELWALQGDSGDDIEGIPGIGPKTALKMIKEHGSLWDVIEDDARCEDYGTRVLENYSMIDLVNGSSGIEIVNNFDTKFDPTYYPQELRDFFLRLEMHSLVRKFDQKDLWRVS